MYDLGTELKVGMSVVGRGSVDGIVCRGFSQLFLRFSNGFHSADLLTQVVVAVVVVVLVVAVVVVVPSNSPVCHALRDLYLKLLQLLLDFLVYELIF